MSKISIEVLREALSYDPESGQLTWRARPQNHFSSSRERNRWNTRYSGALALNHTDPKGYKCGLCNRKALFAHRVAWALAHGAWPAEQIDHINGDRSDNRIGNLREVSSQGNSRNRGIHGNNNSGCTGVSWHKKKQKWAAYISGPDGRSHLGFFTDVNEAIAARKVAEMQIGFYPNRRRDAA